MRNCSFINVCVYFALGVCAALESWLNEKRILTKSSNPRRVPTISLSFFMMIWIREPIHLSTSSEKQDQEMSKLMECRVTHVITLFSNIRINF